MPAAAIGYNKRNTEVWVVRFTGSITGAFGTTSTKQYGTVFRRQGGSSVDTGSLPFSLPSDQNGLVVDVFTNAAVANAGDYQFDIEVAQISQNLFLDANTLNANQSTGRQFLSQPVTLPGTAQIAFAAYWIIGQSAPLAVSIFLKVQIMPRRI